MQKRRQFITGVSGLASGPLLWAGNTSGLEIALDPDSPENSQGRLGGASFPVGLGRNGTTPAGQSFKGGYSLLGDFRISGILSLDRFEMDPELIQQSGKPESWLRSHLFRNMSSIDFDGDGKGGEYGSVFIGLKPVNSSVRQPFHFGKYKGVFRWYSYAIHGTQDQSRIGKCITGGCINVGKEDLTRLSKQVKVGDSVKIHEV